jgi:hypothetical protein
MKPARLSRGGDFLRRARPEHAKAQLDELSE